MSKILIVDDEPANRLLMSTVLKYGGHEVLEASNGSEGLRIATESGPDLIVMDLNMPGMHGTEFLKQLRRDQSGARMRVALYTGTSVNAMMRDFMDVTGIRYVIPKPSEPEEILRIVELALG
jgi:CheY-like chemotaxis protein